MGANESKNLDPKHKPLDEKPALSLVAHRGYHDVDNQLTRPLENTLLAYEKAWQMGYNHCECDVTISKDGDIFLCHDINWLRLSNKKVPLYSEELAQKAACELSSEEVFNKITLLDGTHPSGLIQVLEKAKEISEITSIPKYLVIEIKKDTAWEFFAEEFAKLFENRVDLLKYVSVVMSFDLDMISRVAKVMKLKFSMPHIYFMLLTEGPEHKPKDGVLSGETYFLDVTMPSFVSDCEKLVNGNNLDGIYMEFQEDMVSLKWKREVDENFRQITSRMRIGVWNYAKDQRDGQGLVQIMQERNISFLNTDIPDEYVEMRFAKRA